MADDKRRLFLVAETIPVEHVMHEVIATAWVRFSREAMRAPHDKNKRPLTTFARAEFDATFWVNPHSYVTGFLLFYFK